MNKGIYQISDADKKKIEHVLNQGGRIELIPCKDYVKIIQINRHEVKTEKLNSIPDSKC
jgi:uncharacterized protein YjhX (UPF0386 family)